MFIAAKTVMINVTKFRNKHNSLYIYMYLHMCNWTCIVIYTSTKCSKHNESIMFNSIKYTTKHCIHLL